MAIKKTTVKKAPKKQNRSLTPKQRKVVEKMVENGWNTKGKILKDVWYSEAVQHNPSKVFESKWIIEAFEKAWITDEYLTKKNLEHLEAHIIWKMSFPAWTPVEVIKKELEENIPWVRYITYEPDYNDEWEEVSRLAKFSMPNIKAQDSALDKAYKVKWAYAPEKKQITGKLSLASLFDSVEDEEE